MSREGRPPFGPPDCPWVHNSNGIPENVVGSIGQLSGEDIHVGRVYDGGVYYLGTALADKGVCRYLTRGGELKESDSYEVLTVDCRNPIEFRKMDFDSGLQFIAGGQDDQEDLFYATRVVDGANTYIGWVSRDSKVCHIPRESSNKLSDNFDVMIHNLLDRLCVCPMPPRHDR